MGSSFKSRYWSLLQVVVIVVCCLNKASSDEPMNSTEDGPTDEDDWSRHEDDDHGPNSESTVNSYVGHTMEQDQSKEAQDCVEKQLNLKCPEMKVIAITNVVLGDSYGIWGSCYIRDNDCTHNPSESHRTDVLHRCNSKLNCTIDVFKEKIPCGIGGSMSNNDFERITYDCIDDPRNEATNEWSTVTDYESTVNRNVEQTTKQDLPRIVTSASTTFALYSRPISKAGDQFDATPATPESTSQIIPVVVGIIGLIILIAVVALVAVVMHRRKKSALRKLSPSVPMSKIDNHQNETGVHANEIQGTSEHKSNYAIILKIDKVDEADFTKTGEDPVVYSEVEQRTTIWNGQSQTADQNRKANRIQMDESDAYEEVVEPSKSVSSVFKTDQIGTMGIANKENRPSDNICQLESNDMENIYANESATDPEKHLVTLDVLNISMPHDDDGQTVIENDLYSH